jgi:eukaryotic-like serine/threonine-protein kinase
MAFSLSDYQIIEEIGRGGFATIYHARQKSLGKEVAIKCLAPLKQQNSEQIVRFRREAETMATLTHDNIITVFDYAFYNGSYYIVMEYIQGLTLNAALEKGLPRSPALCVMEKISSALKAAHEHDVIHRDIKPANILIGRSGQVKLADFGLAMLPGSAEFETVAGSVLGTLCYMAPEALASPQAVDARVDIFAFGCILYRILSGKLPFEGTTVGDISYRIMNEKPAPIEAETKLGSITLRCLEKDREHRPSIDEINQVLSETVAPRYNECSALLRSFIARQSEGSIHAPETEETLKPPVAASRSVLALRIAAIAVASLSIAVIVITIAVIALHHDKKTALPTLPAMYSSSSLESMSKAPASARQSKAGPDLPKPLAGTSLDLEVGAIEIIHTRAGDTILLNGRPAPIKRIDDRAQIITTPGIYRLDIHRSRKRPISRQIDLLPYERFTIDLQNERTLNAGDSVSRHR